MSNYQFVPFEFPKSRDGQYILGLDDAGVLRSRRNQLGFTQKQVAEMAGVPVSQYQRFESGERDLANCSMKTGLAICAVLLLDPYDEAGVDIKQPSPEAVKAQTPFDCNIPEELIAPKRAGRKQSRREIMRVFVNYKDSAMLIPYEVFDKIEANAFMQLLWNIPERRIMITAATETSEEPIDIPKQRFEHSLLMIPAFINNENPIAAMGWGNTPYCVEASLVHDQTGRRLILIDLNTAKEADVKEISGVLMVPNCFRDPDDDDDEN